MKKLLCVSLSIVMTLLLLTGCGSKVSNTFDFDGEKVKVTFDTSGGWDVEFGEMATYVYPAKNDGKTDAAGWGVYMSAEEYAERYKEITETYADSYTNVQKLDDGLKYDDVVGHCYIVKISDKTYFMMVSQITAQRLTLRKH